MKENTEIKYETFFESLHNTELEGWVDVLRPSVEAAMQLDAHGKMPEWQAAIRNLPDLTPTTVNLADGVTVDGTCDAATRQQAIDQLLFLHPWRKGPFSLYGIEIDTEWRSDWKWERVKGAVDLRGKRVLDIGCGNGYHGWRMMGAGARQVIGIDPLLVYVMQFWAVNRLLFPPLNPPRWGGSVAPLPPGGAGGGFFVLPVGIEAIPDKSQAFDTVFSMGVLYHRRSPFDHLIKLRDMLRPGGELVLETLVIEGGRGEVLVPEGRYAQMRNVWFLPSVLTLEGWLKKVGFKRVDLVDVTPTTTQEQRTTEWMRFHSLANFLGDDGLTVEGHPPPIRATFVATR